MKITTASFIFSVILISLIISTGSQAIDGSQDLRGPSGLKVLTNGSESVKQGAQERTGTRIKVERIDSVVVGKTSSGLKRMAPQLKQEYMLNLKNAHFSLINGKATQATDYFKKALKIADTTELKAETMFDWANVLSHESRIRGKDPVLQKQAADLYVKTLPNLKGESRLLGYNNYGTLLLRMNDSRKALKTLVAIKADYAKEADAVKRSRFLYNLARAYEINGDLMAASSHFLETARIDPSFSPASRAVIRTIPHMKVSRVVIQDTRKWLSAIVEKGDLKVADKALQTVLSERAWRSQEGFEGTILPLIRYLTITATGPRAFRSEWLNRLSVSDSDSKTVKQIKKEILCLYEGQFPIAFRSTDNIKLIQALLSSEKKYATRGVVSGFIRMIGDSYLADIQYNYALQRYALALNVDNKNTEAALNAATTLLNHSTEIETPRALTNGLINALFHGKGEAYLGEDWENISRFHTVLGTIFKQQNEYGNSHNPYSAIFQFEHAINAHYRLLLQHPEDKWRIAGVKFALAGVYLRTPDLPDPSKSVFLMAGSLPHHRLATDTYVDAAQTAMMEKDYELATDIIRTLRTNHLSLNGRQKAIIKNVENYIEAKGPR